MRLLIADDHATIRIGLKHILKREFDNIEFLEASHSMEVLRLARAEKLDFLVLDINLPGRNGLEILKELRGEGNRIPILVFSFHHEDQVAIRVLRAGADGFLSKDAGDQQIIDAIRQILAGRKFIPASIAELMVLHLQSPLSKEVHEILSSREFQTLLQIASGKTVSQISEELSLSISTVSTYRTRILEKMQMKTNAELVRYAIENKLI